MDQADHQVFNEICSLGIYKDCLVSSLNLFLDGLGTPSSSKPDNLSKLETLRISHHPHIVNPSYAQLMYDKLPWAISGVNLCPNDHRHDDMLRMTWNLRIDSRNWTVAANRIRKAMTEGVDVFPKLERVVMMGEVDDDDTVEWRHEEKAICEVLISLPSVAYYCQASGLGPLALPNTVYQPLHPPKIATFHLSRSTKIWECLELPPIILGATNRYILSGPIRMETSRPFRLTDLAGGWIKPLNMIPHMLNSRTHVTKQLAPSNTTTSDENVTEQIPFDSVSLDGTSIEIYNFLINVISPDITLCASKELKPKHIHPLGLDICQALEKQIHDKLGRWRGKVIIRDGSELPVCPACRFEGPIPPNEATSYNDVAGAVVVE